MTPKASLVSAEDVFVLTKTAWDFAAKGAGVTIEGIGDFIHRIENQTLSQDEKVAILDQAILILNSFYSHLPFKIDRIPQVKNLASELEDLRQDLSSVSERKFHESIIGVFTMLEDAHTLYFLPDPYRGAVAFLPFQIKTYSTADHPTSDGSFAHKTYHHVVTQVMSGFDHPHFKTGAIIRKWCGTDITRVGGDDDEKFRQRITSGGGIGPNHDAMFARWARTSTLRPLTFFFLPKEDELLGSHRSSVMLEYMPAEGGATRRISIPWGVATGFSTPGFFGMPSSSMNMIGHDYQMFSKVLYWQPATPGSPAAPSPSLSPEALQLNSPSGLAETFDIQFTGGVQKDDVVDPAFLVDPTSNEQGRFGYIRIRHFSDNGTLKAETAQRLSTEFQRILQLMDRATPDGLILDIRGNPGGELSAGEQMLQLLSPATISPSLFHLPNTPQMVEILAQLAASPEGAASELRPWLRDSTNQPLPAGERLTSGQHMTLPEHANALGQAYQGPIVLLTDALTYSAAEIFAAGFQDHEIGTILGLHLNTGGGGANVWTHQELLDKVGKFSGMKLAPLPDPPGATMTVAIRRMSRVGTTQRFVEDIGVQSDVVYTAADAADVINGYPGLFRTACELLHKKTRYRVDIVKADVQADQSVELDLAATNIDLVDVYLSGQGDLAPTLRIEKSPVTRGANVQLRVPAIPAAPVRLIVKAFTAEVPPTLRASCRVEFQVLEADLTTPTDS